MKRKLVVLVRNAAAYDFGGGERFPTFVGIALKSTDYSSLVLSRSKSVREFANSKGVNTQISPWWSNQNWSGWRLLLTPVYVLWQFILTIYYLSIFIYLRPLVVHIQSKDDFIAATIAGRISGAHVVWTDHGDLKYIWKNLSIWYKNPIGKLIYISALLANSIAVVSRNEKSLISSNLPTRSFIYRKLELVYNGCDDAHSSKPRKRSKKFTFCVANRLVTDKGIGDVIEAYKRIQSEFDNTKLLILGDGPESETFHNLAKGISSIDFAGHQNNPYEAMSRCDVFIQPTHHDAFSVVLVEACMLELPIIATSVGGNPEIISSEKNGLLVSPKCPDELYQAMKRLINDNSLRKNISAAARQTYLNRFIFNDIVRRQYITLYNGLRLHTISSKPTITIESSAIEQLGPTGVNYFTNGLAQALERRSDIYVNYLWLNFLGRRNPHNQLMIDAALSGRLQQIRYIPQRVYAKLLFIGIAPPLLVRRSDWVIYPNFYLWPSIIKTKKAIIIHDVTYLRHPDYVEEKNRRFLSKVVAWSLDRTDAVISNSQSTTSEIVKFLGVDPSRIITIDIPVDESQFDNKLNKGSDYLDKKLGISKPYILSLGTLEPRKNLELIVEAYCRLPRKVRHSHSLVLAGKWGWKIESLRQLILEKQAAGFDIITTGSVDTEGRASLYRNASYYAIGSHYEGFGMPLLEAMYCGIPTVAVDIPVLREVGADGCVWAKRDPKDFSDKLLYLINHPLESKIISNKGKSRASEYSWSKTADELIQQLNKH